MCQSWWQPTMHIHGLHQIVLHDFGKEREIGKLQTPMLHVHNYVQGGLQ